MADKRAAPYRASIDAGAPGADGRTRPNLADSSSASDNGRILLSFRFAELRDLFVETHAAQGAQAEPDGAEQASCRHPVARDPITESDELKLALYYASTAHELKLADDLIRRAFNDRVTALARGGRIPEAVAVIASMPCCEFRTQAVATLAETGRWDPVAMPVEAAVPAPYTRQRAVAMLAWFRARWAHAEAAAMNRKSLRKVVDDLVARDDPRGLADLAERTLDPSARADVLAALHGRIPGGTAVAAR